MPNKKFDGETVPIHLSNQVKEAMDKDPDTANALKEFVAMLRQAQQGLHDGKYETFDEAMRAQGADPQPLSQEDIDRLGLDLDDFDG